MRLVGRAVRHPALVLLRPLALLVGGAVAYGRYGSGVEFFPNVEPEYGLLYVHARGNLSIDEKDALVRQAEERILGWPGVKSVYTRVGKRRGQDGDDVDEDVVGVIQYEFVDWRERESAARHPRRAARRDDRHSRRRRRGLGARTPARRPARRSRSGCRPSIRPASTTPPAQVADDAARHARRDRRLRRPAGARRRLGARGRSRQGRAVRRLAPAAVGSVVQLVTNGLKLTDFRPAGADDAVDIRMRLPEDRRTFATLDSLRIETAAGSVPIANFVSAHRAAAPPAC